MQQDCEDCSDQVQSNSNAGDPGNPAFDFKELIQRECRRLNRTPGETSCTADVDIARSGPADEPWVAFIDRDLVGLALSGGGIRSATFNLGLLQALDRRRVIEHIDYLSTVSGGGYIGGFWTAWRHRHALNGGTRLDRDGRRMIFPHQTESASGARFSPDEVRETAEVRHLREFSRFLMPRLGFFHSETWSGLVNILGGALPSLFATVALVGLFFSGWFYANYGLVTLSGWGRMGAFAALTLVIHASSELRWQRSGKSGRAQKDDWDYTWFGLLAIGLSSVAWWLWTERWMGGATLTDWALRAGRPEELGPISGVLFGPSVAWALAGVALLVIRALFSRAFSARSHASVEGELDRATSRCLAPAMVWSCLALGWELCEWIQVTTMQFKPLHATAGGAVGFGAVFVWLRHWLSTSHEETRGTRLVDRLACWLKPMAPRLAANAAVLLLFLSVGLAIQQPLLRENAWPAAGVALVILGATLVAFDPARVGLHDFYRARIARCFLGAASPRRAEDNRATSELDDDDVTLGELRQPGSGARRNASIDSALQRRPVHLICCAANNLSGDILGSLYRGARSAVLSPEGISLGNHTGPLDHLRLSAALTASAAAFNSQMGRVSMNLGPAVAFLMSALNLRLGLWVPHPLNPHRTRYWLPGWYFFLEMFGLTQCDPIRPANSTPDAPPVSQQESKLARAVSLARHQLNLRSRNLHLSDGSHFENLGLYELVRRHCRYLIVSDCSADPEVAFDDLANALRRVREDFGVEIEMDVDLLRPGSDGRSRQHAVVGTIHYDGLGGTDKGTLLYFKPTLTGDEPPDVLQYQARNPAFPHEGTGDQFYDEAQWESYRRLGEHAVNSALRFLDRPTSKKAGRKGASFVENLFLDASQHWHQLPQNFQEKFIVLTERCSAFEAEIREHAPAVLRHEFFPEVAAIAGLHAPYDPPTPEETMRTLHFIFQAGQLMEDIWITAQLDTYWSHPLNEGWMSYFERWAATPSFRRWWPVVRPIYSRGFRDFIKDRFNIRIRDDMARKEPPGDGARLTLRQRCLPETVRAGLAWQQCVRRFGEPSLEGVELAEYMLTLDPPLELAEERPIQVGVVLLTTGTDPTTGKTFLQWNSQHLLVPPFLVGAGITARLLDRLIVHCCDETCLDQIRVVLSEDSPVHAEARPGVAPTGPRKRLQPDPASRRARVHRINFYKSRGFTYLRHEADGGVLRTLVFDLVAARPERAARSDLVAR
jgi:hypothetical protein